MGTNKPELEALSAVSEMLLFDKARGNSSRSTKLCLCDEKRHIVPNIDLIITRQPRHSAATCTTSYKTKAQKLINQTGTQIALLNTRHFQVLAI